MVRVKLTEAQLVALLAAPADMRSALWVYFGNLPYTRRRPRIGRACGAVLASLRLRSLITKDDSITPLGRVALASQEEK